MFIIQITKSQIDFITNIYKKNFDFVINLMDDEIPKISSERRFSPMDRSLRRELKSTLEMKTTGLVQ